MRIYYREYTTSVGRTIHNIRIGYAVLRWGTRQGKWEAGPWFDWDNYHRHPERRNTQPTGERSE